MAAHGSTKPAAGVMATRPATKPVHAPTSVGLPTRIRSTSIHDNMPAAEATIVLSNARAATPSAANCQPVRIWVIKSEEALARLRKIHPCYGAPVVLVVGCRNEEAWVRESDGVIAAKTDAAIVLTHMMLTATDAGLANMWIWDFDPAKIREAFPEIREHGVYGLLAIGHPAAGQGKPTELHDQRKPIEDLVKEL